MIHVTNLIEELDLFHKWFILYLKWNASSLSFRVLPNNVVDVIYKLTSKQTSKKRSFRLAGLEKLLELSLQFCKGVGWITRITIFQVALFSYVFHLIQWNVIKFFQNHQGEWWETSWFITFCWGESWTLLNEAVHKKQILCRRPKK